MFLAIPSANPDNGLALLCGSTQPPALFPSSMEVLLKIHMEKLQVVTSKINFIYRFSGTAWQIDKEWVWYKGGLVKDDLVLDQHWKTSHHLVCVDLEVQIFFLGNATEHYCRAASLQSESGLKQGSCIDSSGPWMKAVALTLSPNCSVLVTSRSTFKGLAFRELTL